MSGKLFIKSKTTDLVSPLCSENNRSEITKAYIFIPWLWFYWTKNVSPIILPYHFCRILWIMSIYINLPQTQSCIGYTVNAIWWYSSVLQHDVPTKPSPGHAHNDKDKYWLNRWDLTVAGSWRGIRPLCSGAQLANEISAPRSSNERRCSHPARDTCYLAQRLSCERLRQIGGVLSVWHPPPASLSRDNLAQASHFFSG